MRHLICFFLVLFFSSQALAVQPDEILPDKNMEARARNLSGGFRCLVCKNESIDESNADLARDLRIIIRERLVQGDSDEQVTEFVVSRYGEYVLLKPRLSARTLILWSLPFLIVIIGLIVFIRRKPPAPSASEKDLTPEEKEKLRHLSQ